MSSVAVLLEAAPDPFATVRALNRMRAAGFALSVRNDRLAISPFSRLSEQQRAFIGSHKPAMVALLEDAEILHHALVDAGPAGLDWREGTPADWDDTRLLVAGEMLYSTGRMVNAHGRRYAAESVPAPGSRLDLRNRGNRLFQQARALRLAEAEKRESPPDNPDIARDNLQPTAAPPKCPAKPLTCQPAANYPFRYVTKCDRPTPIPNPAGFGDPIGCSNCGAIFAEGVAS